MNDINSTLPGIKIYTNENDMKFALFEQDEVISDAIRQDGFWNMNILKMINLILNKQPRGSVLDIGAGLGSVTIPISCANNRKFEVHSFEPLKPIFLQLAANVLLNNLGFVKVYNVGLSDRNELIESNVLDVHRSSNHGSFSFNEEVNALRNIHPTEKKEKYEMRTLDSYELKNIRFIKLSAPGMESKVLEGSRNTLIANDFPPIVMEHWGMDWYKPEIDRVMAVLESVGYKHIEYLGGYMFVFKDVYQFEFYTSDSQSVEAGDFIISEKLHDTEETLADQKVYGQT